MTQDELLNWLNQGPMVQVGPETWVHENQALWEQNPTLQLTDGTMVRFDDLMQQGQMVTDGTSWMTEEMFRWNHRNDETEWFRQDDGTMITLDQYRQQGPIVQGGVHENEFLLDHPGEPFVFVPNGEDETTGTMVPLEQYLDEDSQDNPMVTAPDGTSIHWRRFIHENGDGGDNPWVVAPNGQVMRQTELAQWGPPTTGPDGQTMTQGQYILNHPDDAKNPWVYLPFNPDDPYSAYLDPQYLDANGVDVKVSAPRTATTLSDYQGKTALGIRSMVGLAGVLVDRRTELANVWQTLIAEMANVENALGYNMIPMGEGYAGAVRIKNEVHKFVEQVWRPAWENMVGNGDITDGHHGGWFAQAFVNIGNTSEQFIMAAKGAYKLEQDTLDGFRAAGYEIDTTMPEDPQVLMDGGRAGPG